MKKDKGFTLVELLAVIILIGVVAVIAVPTVNKITKEAKQKTLDRQIETIVNSAKDWAVKNSEVLPENDSSILVTMDTLKTSGFLENKKIINPVNNKEMNACVEIIYDSDYNQYKYLYNETCNVMNPNISSSDNCIQDINSICQNGVKVNVQVNASEAYDFYIIKDTGRELTLIMDRNLGENENWINETDYTQAGGSNWTGGALVNDKGPLTALKALEERTKNWINIPSMTYTLEDDKPDAYGSTIRYQSIKITNAKARLLTYTEANNLGCSYDSENSCPSYLYDNTKNHGDDSTYGYWLSTADSSYADSSWFVYGEYGDMLCSESPNNNHGIRPVITISKSTLIF